MIYFYPFLMYTAHQYKRIFKWLLTDTWRLFFDNFGHLTFVASHYWFITMIVTLTYHGFWQKTLKVIEDLMRRHGNDLLVRCYEIRNIFFFFLKNHTQKSRPYLHTCCLREVTHVYIYQNQWKWNWLTQVLYQMRA